MEKLYTIEEVAEILRIEPSTCSKWIREGSIPHIRLNGSFKSVRIPASLLEAYIEKQKEEQAEHSKINEYDIKPAISEPDESVYSKYNFV
jgi:excisionase family DNA binding protein